MKMALINGSPKGGPSNSGLLLEKLKPLITEGNELNSYRVNAKQLKPEQYRELNEADVIVHFRSILTPSLHIYYG
ncbi:hypothetical protein D1872_275450 [compost metagenome]